MGDNYITTERLNDSNVLFVKICKNCGTESNDGLDGNDCDCGSPNFVLIDANPINYFNRYTQKQKDELIKEALQLSDEEYVELKNKWFEVNESLAETEMYKRYEDGKETLAIPKPVIKNTPKCPTCNSTNVAKISTAKKAFGFAAVGIFSSNFGKTMECKNCGYKF
ncbi:MAG: hypothetical protein IJZ64_07855 [Ruminococcus sp.]|nr:hypothetical protein [Ruminococcus sp.]